MELTLSSKRNNYSATCELNDGVFVVKKGSKICMRFSEHIKGGTFAKKYREDRNFVSDDGVVLKDCSFNSASTAAQFVTGSSTNGMVAWKSKDRKKLKDIL